MGCCECKSAARNQRERLELGEKAWGKHARGFALSAPNSSPLFAIRSTSKTSTKRRSVAAERRSSPPASKMSSARSASQEPPARRSACRSSAAERKGQQQQTQWHQKEPDGGCLVKHADHLDQLVAELSDLQLQIQQLSQERAASPEKISSLPLDSSQRLNIDSTSMCSGSTGVSSPSSTRSSSPRQEISTLSLPLIIISDLTEKPAMVFQISPPSARKKPNASGPEADAVNWRLDVVS